MVILFLYLGKKYFWNNDPIGHKLYSRYYNYIKLSQIYYENLGISQNFWKYSANEQGYLWYLKQHKSDNKRDNFIYKQKQQFHCIVSIFRHIPGQKK